MRIWRGCDMARDRANIRTDMLGDDNYRDLTIIEQWLYKVLLIHPTLSYAGVAEWRPARLAAMAAGATVDIVKNAATGLQAKHFIYVDEATEEVLVRSFVKHDGLLKQYRLPVSMANDYAGIASREIREFFIYELQRIHTEDPTMKCWEVDRVKALLKGRAVNMKQLAHGDTLPITFADGHADTYAIDPDQGYGLATATATTTATKECLPPSRRKPETPLPENWAPNEAHTKYAKTEGVNLTFQADRFTNWAKSKDARYRDWDAAFRNWLLKAEKSQTNSPSPWDQKGIHA